MALNSGDEGTVKDSPNFSAAKDAEVVYKAGKGAGTDEETVINLLVNRSNKQRQMIAEAFSKEYKEELTRFLKDEFNGFREHNIRQTLGAMIDKPCKFDARSCQRALFSAGADESVLVEVLCTRSIEERQEIAKYFDSTHPKDLISTRKRVKSGNFENLLSTLLTTKRNPQLNENEATAKEDAKKLQESGLKGTFDGIFANRSLAHMRHVFQGYELMAHKSIEDAVKELPRDDYQRALLSMISIVKDKDHYFANRVNQAVKGLGTTDNQLIRIVVSRSEKDLVQIKKSYEKHFSTPLRRILEGNIGLHLDDLHDQENNSLHYIKVILGLIK